MKKNKIEDHSMPQALAKFATGVGVGIVAGMVGTAIMTAAQMLEMKYTGRKPSNTPYKAVKKTFGIEAQTDEDKELVTNVAHVAYGTTWGIPRGLMAVYGADGAAGTTAHLGAVWGTEVSLLPAMDVMEPVTTWKPKAVATDILFHAIYALTAGITADTLAKHFQIK